LTTTPQSHGPGSAERAGGGDIIGASSQPAWFRADLMSAQPGSVSAEVAAVNTRTDDLIACTTSESAAALAP